MEVCKGDLPKRKEMKTKKNSPKANGKRKEDRMEAKKKKESHQIIVSPLFPFIYLS